METNPLYWSTKWRRLFLLTLPISGPIYLIIAAAYHVLIGFIVLIMIFYMLLCSLLYWILEMWGVKNIPSWVRTGTWWDV